MQDIKKNAKSSLYTRKEQIKAVCSFYVLVLSVPRKAKLTANGDAIHSFGNQSSVSTKNTLIMRSASSAIQSGNDVVSSLVCTYALYRDASR